MARGKKLVIEFDIIPIDGFAGGNNIPTNGSESGIYVPDENGDLQPIKPYPKPEVNIPISEPSGIMVSNEFVIYRSNAIDVENIIQVYNSEKTLLDDFVNRTVTVNGTTLPDGLFAPEQTTAYPKNTVTVTITPKTDKEESSVGEEAIEVSVQNDEDFTIFVLQPNITVTTNDVEAYFGSDYTIGTGCTPSYNLVWKENALTSPKTEADITTGISTIKVPFTKDYLDVQYSITGSTETSVKVTKKPLSVNTQVVLKANDPSKDPTPVPDEFVTSLVTCEYGCSPASRESTSYLIHAKTCSLTITNDGGNASDVFFYKILKSDGSVYATVPVSGSSSVTVSELPVGDYTVVLDGDWSWHYTSDFADGVATASLTATDPTATIPASTYPRTLHGSALSVRWFRMNMVKEATDPYENVQY